jgi:hypothetical protein
MTDPRDSAMEILLALAAPVSYGVSDFAGASSPGGRTSS